MIIYLQKIYTYETSHICFHYKAECFKRNPKVVTWYEYWWSNIIQISSRVIKGYIPICIGYSDTSKVVGSCYDFFSEWN